MIATATIATAVAAAAVMCLRGRCSIPRATDGIEDRRGEGITQGDLAAEMRVVDHPLVAHFVQIQILRGK